MRHTSRRWAGPGPALLLLALVPLGCQRQRSQEEPKPQPAPQGLSKADNKAARKIAESAEDFKGLLSDAEHVIPPGEKVRDLKPKDMVVFTGIEAAAAKDDGERPREAARGGGTVVVTHYRYKTDETILSTVDLNTRKVLRVTKVMHMPTPLSEDELKLARELAAENERIKKILDARGGRLQMAPLVPRVGEKDSLYGHRLVNLLLHDGPVYLSSPQVMVDLTTRKVTVKEVKPPMADMDREHKE